MHLCNTRPKSCSYKGNKNGLLIDTRQQYELYEIKFYRKIKPSDQKNPHRYNVQHDFGQSKFLKADRTAF